MKILVINTVPTDKNGITNVIFNYLGAFSNRVRYDYVAINEPGKRYVEFLEARGAALYCLKRRNVASYVRSLYKIMKRGRHDLVHVHGNSHTVVLELLAARLAGCRVRMVHAHSTMCNSVTLHRFLAAPFNRLCTHRLACGELAGKFMFGAKPFGMVRNGVDVARYAFDDGARTSVRKDLGLSDDDILIGHVGYFLAVKNQSFLVDVFAELSMADPRYRLVLIGDGDMRADVERKVERLGLKDKVAFTGIIDNVPDYLCAIDLVVMPSLYEGLPLALVEQQANGLQCVVADTITKEADKTGNLRFISLDAPIAQWVRAISETDCKQGRKRRSEEAAAAIAQSGYSIQVEAGKLEEYYLSQLAN